MWASVGSFSGGTGPRATVHVSGGPGRRADSTASGDSSASPRLRPDRLWQSCYRTTACCTRLPPRLRTAGKLSPSGSQVLRPVRGNVRFFLLQLVQQFLQIVRHTSAPFRIRSYRSWSKAGLTAPPPWPEGGPAHWASGLLRPGAAGGAQPLQLLLLVQRQVGQAPHIVPVPHGLGPRLRGQCAEGPQHPPAQPVRPVGG